MVMVSPEIASTLVQKAPKRKRFIRKKLDYSTQDIVSYILRADATPQFVDDVAKLAPTLKGKTEFETARNIYNFVFHNVKYKLDSPGEQNVKTPARLWADREGDCKSMSLFEGALFKNLGIPYSYRFASYSDMPVFTHVYVIAHTKDGDVIIDPVYKHFNKQKQYVYHKDYKMPGLAIVAGLDTEMGSVHYRSLLLRNRRRRGLRGFDDEPQVGLFKKLRKKISSAVQNVAKKAIDLKKNVDNKIKSGLKTVGKGIAKAAKAVAKGAVNVVKKGVQFTKWATFAPIRASYLVLLRFNVHSYATKMSKADKDKVSNIWKKIGGDPKQLWNVVNIGKDKPHILGIGDLEGIGATYREHRKITGKTRRAWYAKQKAKLKAVHPNMSDADLKKLLAAQWREAAHRHLRRRNPAVKKWVKKPGVHGIGEDEHYVGIGVLPAAALAAAATAIKMFAPLLKNIVGNKGKGGDPNQNLDESAVPQQTAEPQNSDVSSAPSTDVQNLAASSFTETDTPNLPRAVRATLIQTSQALAKGENVAEPDTDTPSDQPKMKRSSRAKLMAAKQDADAQAPATATPIYKNPLVLGLGAAGLLGTLYMATRKGRK